MDQGTRDWLNRIEGKLDASIAAQAEAGKITTKNETDIWWLKGGVSMCLTIILACASFIAAEFFGLLSNK